MQQGMEWRKEKKNELHVSPTCLSFKKPRGIEHIKLNDLPCKLSGKLEDKITLDYFTHSTIHKEDATSLTPTDPWSQQHFLTPFFISFAD